MTYGPLLFVAALGIGLVVPFVCWLFSKNMWGDDEEASKHS